MTTSTVTSAAPTLTFGSGLPGFPGERRFELVRLDPADDVGLYLLQAVDGDVRFVAAAPPLYFPEYAPEIDDATAARLGLADEADALVLVLITVGEDLARSTANLLAPVVVNRTSHAAAQVVLNTDYPVKAPLFATQGATTS